MREGKHTRWVVIGLCGILTAVAVYAIYKYRSKRIHIKDPKVIKVKELIAEADELLHQFR